MAWSSKVPDLMDALVVAWSQAPELSGATVQDGPFVDQSPTQQVLCVGWTGGDDETSVEGNIAQEGMARSPDREQITIRCAAAVLVGTTDISTARHAAYGLMAAAGDVIARERTLGGVLRAGIGTHQLTWNQTKNGAQATVVFEVTADAYTGR